MPVNVYLLNRTYIAQDSTTGLTAYGINEKAATEKLHQLLTQYWDKKKIVVPITTLPEPSPPKHPKGNNG